MSKSIKLKNNNYWDSDSIVYGHTLLSSYLWHLDKMINNSKQVWTGTSDGINITVNKYVNDKMPILILGSDNGSAEPICILLFANRDTTGTRTSIVGSKQLSGSNRALTRYGNTYHIVSAIYSTYWILAPIGADISVSNASL